MVFFENLSHSYVESRCKCERLSRPFFVSGVFCHTHTHAHNTHTHTPCDTYTYTQWHTPSHTHTVHTNTHTHKFQMAVMVFKEYYGVRLRAHRITCLIDEYKDHTVRGEGAERPAWSPYDE